MISAAEAALFYWEAEYIACVNLDDSDMGHRYGPNSMLFNARMKSR